MLKWCSGVCGFSQHLGQVRGTLLLKRKTLPIETPQVSVFEENHCLDRIFNMKLWGHNPLISLILLLSIIFILHPREAKGCYVFSSCLLGRICGGELRVCEQKEVLSSCVGRHSQLRYCGLFCTQDLPRMHWRDICIYVYVYLWFTEVMHKIAVDRWNAK